MHETFIPGDDVQKQVLFKHCKGQNKQYKLSGIFWQYVPCTYHLPTAAVKRLPQIQ